MNIFSYSPKYLGALYEESKKYNFNLQGYRIISKALDGLLKTNSMDIAGFCVVLTSLQDEDLDGLRTFIKRCDLYSDPVNNVKKRFVVALFDSSGIEQFLKSCGTKNLEFYLSEVKILTDVIVKREIFGTLLDGVFTPYKGSKIQSSVIMPKELPLLKLNLPFPRDLLMAISPVQKLDTLTRTIVEDRILEHLYNTQSLYSSVRNYKIHEMFGEGTPHRKKVIDLLSKKGDISEKLLLEFVLRGDVNARS